MYNAKIIFSAKRIFTVVKLSMVWWGRTTTLQRSLSVWEQLARGGAAGRSGSDDGGCKRGGGHATQQLLKETLPALWGGTCKTFKTA